MRPFSWLASVRLLKVMVVASESVRVTPLPLTIALFWRLEAEPVDA